MLTKLTVRNFKRFDEAEFDLGPVTVLCGPNNFGKTTALQAIALWSAGLSQWLAKRGIESSAAQRVGVSINRRDLVALPVPSTSLLWHRLRTRNSWRDEDDNQRVSNVRIEIVAEGVDAGTAWRCGLEFDYPNEESIYCRPLRLSEGKSPERMTIPPEVAFLKIALLPPMSGLAAMEPKWEPGRIEVLIGEGQTAQILRNICYQIFTNRPDLWTTLVGHIRHLFSITIEQPQHITARGEITMGYKDSDGISLDLSSAGRGLQQILLLLAHLYANPGAILLLDEPDAHLEILRQREIYGLISNIAREQKCQIIAASHSEVVLQEAASRDVVISFVGKPHRLDDRGSHLLKWLRDYPIDHIYQAEIKGWVLYLEGSTDLAILQAFAEKLEHPAVECLRAPFVMYVANDVQRAARHFHALREAKNDIAGFALFDRLDGPLSQNIGPVAQMWTRREIENYFCTREVLLAFSGRQLDETDLIQRAERHRQHEAMQEAIDRIEGAQRELDRDIWSKDIKATDEVLDPIFKRYFNKLGFPMQFRKSDYHELAYLLKLDQVDPEIIQKLDALAAVAAAAKPRR